MNSKEFLERLNVLLQDIPQEERAEAMRFYTEYFSEAGPDEEQAILNELGSPEEVAQAVRQSIPGAEEGSSAQEPVRNIPVPIYARREQPGYDYAQPRPPRDKKSVTILLVLLAVLTFPLWIGLVMGALGIVLAVVVGSAAILLAGGVTFIAALVMLVLRAAVLFSAGLGSGLLAAGLLLLAAAAGLLLMGAGAFVLFWLIPAVCRVTKRYIIDPIRGKGVTAV